MGEPRPDEFDQLALGDAGAGDGDERHRPLAPARVRHGDHGGLQDVGVGGQHFLHLDGGDVLPAADDDVLAPVGELDVTIRVDHREVAGVEPAAAEGVLGGLVVIEVTGHDGVGTHQDLAGRRAVGGHRPGLLVSDQDVAHRDRRDALPAEALGQLLRRQVRPALLVLADQGGAGGGQLELQGDAHRVQVGAAMGVHDALGSAGCAARVIDGDHVVLVRRRNEPAVVAAREPFVIRNRSRQWLPGRARQEHDPLNRQLVRAGS